MKVNAIRIAKSGAPDVMKWQSVDLGKPRAGQALVRHTAVGLNFIDTYQRSGLYPMELPSGIGLEAAGVVERVGRGVKNVKPGDRVAYAGGPAGAYAEARVMPAHVLVKLPAKISDQQAAAMMLKGMTVQYLLCRTHKVRKGETIVFHAAAGGVGLIAGQWAHAIGATVIGTAGGATKCGLAKKYGYDHVIDYTKQNFTDQVRRLTKGRGVPVVYDAVGKSTFEGSLDCLAPLGLLVSFGNASGAVDPFPPGILGAKGSLYFTRPTLMTYNASRPELEASARSLFRMVTSGKVKIEVNQTYPLKDAVKAHRDLEGRKTTGSTVLIP